MELSRRGRRAVHSLALLVVIVAAGCGREGGAGALPDRARFCKIAIALSGDASATMAPLGDNPPLAEVATTFDRFLRRHREDYAELDRVAPTEIRAALRRQRAAQQAFIKATSDEERRATYAVAVENGRAIADYEDGICY